MESFAAKFPRIYLDSSFKGWFVSTLLLFAWFGSLVNGPVADRVGRKGSILVAVVIFTLGSALQAAAESIPMLFAGTFGTDPVEKFGRHAYSSPQDVRSPGFLSACSR